MIISANMITTLDYIIIPILSLLNCVLIGVLSLQFLQMYQLCGYKFSGVKAWLKDTKFNYTSRLFMISFLSSIALLITNVLLDPVLKYKPLKYFSVVFYIIFMLVYVVSVSRQHQKTPLKYTNRIKRLIFTLCTLSAILSAGLTFVSSAFIPFFTGGGTVIMPLFIPVLVMLSSLVMLPIERKINRGYIKKAKAKLNKISPVVIGITGSCGKTSVKNILSTILESKYNVCASPKNFNTPMGLCRTILDYMKDSDNVFVAEMGARHVNDINELCQFVCPTIGVITSIGNQHLETFGSEQNLVKTKGELPDYISLCGGQMVYNTDSAGARKMFDSYGGKKFSAGLDLGQFKAKNIKLSGVGSSFTLVTPDGEFKGVKTKLLGKHNISNIVTAVAAARLLDVPYEDIIEKIANLVAPEHRLQIVPTNNELVVIDDAYNSNIEGYKNALEVISSYAGGKVIITPGLIELGSEQFNCNFQFGKDMAQVASYVIITALTNKTALTEGLLFGGFDQNKILYAIDLDSATKLLPNITSPGDVVLFENDLPDNYI